MRGSSLASAAQPYDRPLLDRSRMSLGGVCVTRMSIPAGTRAQASVSSARPGEGVRRQVGHPRRAEDRQAAELDHLVAEVVSVLQRLRLSHQCRFEFAVMIPAGVEDALELLAAEPCIDAGELLGRPAEQIADVAAVDQQVARRQHEVLVAAVRVADDRDAGLHVAFSIAKPRCPATDWPGARQHPETATTIAGARPPVPR